MPVQTDSEILARATEVRDETAKKANTSLRVGQLLYDMWLSLLDRIASISLTPGPAGADGADANVWRNGTGAPSDAMGSDSDYYLDDANGDVYQRSAGVYSVVGNIKGETGAAGAAGATGATGAAGADGSVWRNGTGVPSNGLGANGDYYLNDANGDVYLRSSGTYSVVANIKGATGAAGAAGATGATGATGAAGSVWRDGSGVPSNGLGANGDYYLNDANGDVYLRSSGTYSVVANIKGATGADGTAADIAALTHAATSKSTPVDADEIPLLDSAASYVLKKLTWANLKATIWAAITGDVTINSSGVSAIGSNKVTLAMMATIATRRLLGRTTSGTGNVESLTMDQLWTLLSNTTDNTGSGTLAAVSTSDLNSLRFTNAPTIRGFANGASGKYLVILNDHATSSITINNEDGTETAANRVKTGGQNIVIPAQCAALLIYNSTNSRWNIISIHGNPYFPTMAGTGTRIVQVDANGNATAGNGIVQLFQFAQTTDVTVTAASLTSILTGTIVGTTTLLASSNTTNPMFVAGKSYKGYFGGIFSSLNAATFQILIKIGSVTLIDTGALAMIANTTKGFRVEYDFTIQTTGATGTVIANLKFEIDGQASFVTSASSATIDTTSDRILDIQVAYGATNASNTVTVRQAKCNQDAN